MQLATIEVPDATELTQQSATLVDTANAIVIDSDGANAKAGETLVAIKGMRKRIVEWFAESKSAAHKAHKAITKQEKDLDAIPAKAEAIIKSKMEAYYAKQERARREEEERLREEARKEAEERQLAEAEAAEASGDKEAAEALINTPPPEPVVIPSTQRPAKVEGVSTTKIRRYRIVDEARVPRSFLSVDEKKLAGYARSMGDAASVPGVEFYWETSVRSRS